MENPQDSLPIHLQYRRDEEVVRAEQILADAVKATAQKLATSNHINPKQFAENHFLPVVTSIVQFFSLQHGDMVKFFTKAMIAQSEGDMPETLVGIPGDDVDAILGELERFDLFLVKIDSLGGNKKEALEEIKKEAKEFRKMLVDLSEAIQEYSLETEDDEEGFIEFEDPEENVVELKEASNE